MECHPRVSTRTDLETVEQRGCVQLRLKATQWPSVDVTRSPMLSVSALATCSGLCLEASVLYLHVACAPVSDRCSPESGKPKRGGYLGLGALTCFPCDLMIISSALHAISVDENFHRNAPPSDSGERVAPRTGVVPKSSCQGFQAKPFQFLRWRMMSLVLGLVRIWT